MDLRTIWHRNALDAASCPAGDNVSRVLRRPIGGWNARIWRREVRQWLLFAAFVVGSWAALNMFAGAVGVVAGVM
jgi:hypothetical protein